MMAKALQVGTRRSVEGFGHRVKRHGGTGQLKVLNGWSVKEMQKLRNAGRKHV